MTTPVNHTLSAALVAAGENKPEDIVKLTKRLAEVPVCHRHDNPDLQNVAYRTHDIKQKGELLGRVLHEIKLDKDPKHSTARAVGALAVSSMISLVGAVVTFEYVAMVSLILSSGEGGTTSILMTAGIIAAIVAAVIFESLDDPEMIVSSERLQEKKKEVLEDLIKEILLLDGQLRNKVHKGQLAEKVETVELNRLKAERVKLLGESKRANAAAEAGRQVDLLENRQATEILMRRIKHTSAVTAALENNLDALKEFGAKVTQMSSAAAPAGVSAARATPAAAKTETEKASVTDPVASDASKQAPSTDTQPKKQAGEPEKAKVSADSKFPESGSVREKVNFWESDKNKDRAPVEVMRRHRGIGTPAKT